MLSVQTAGYAGMERLGVPARTSINSSSDDRGHISRRMRVEAIQAREIVRDAISDRHNRNNHNNIHHYHNRGGCVNGARGIDNCYIGSGCTSVIPVQSSENHKKAGIVQQQSQNVIRCPHHVPLPDCEFGQDRDLQIRSEYQNSEIVRTYIRPPPNKTVLDVPQQSFNLYTSTGISCNLGNNFNNQHHNNYHQQQQHQQQMLLQQQLLQQQQQQHQQHQQKSKPNVIQKLFSRKNSPKSPQPSPTPLSSSSSSSTSTSSSSSSLIALPISTASAVLASTALTTISTNTNPSISSSISLVTTSTDTVTSSATTLQLYKSKSCNLSETSLVTSASTSSLGSLSPHSTDCCYIQATSVRSNDILTNRPTTSNISVTNNQQQQLHLQLQQKLQQNQQRDNV